MDESDLMRVPWHLLRDRASIAAPVETPQDTGMYATAWGTPKTGLSAVPCTLQQTSSGDSLAYMRETGRATMRLHLPKTYGGVSVVVNKQDRITVTPFGGTATAYRVVGQGGDLGGQGANQFVTLETMEQ